MSLLKLSVLQLEINDAESTDQRLQKVEAFLDEAGDCDLAVLPELWNVGYFSFDQYCKESDLLTGATLKRISAKACERQIHVFAGSIVEREGGNLYNTAVLFSPQGKVIATYRKLYLFGYGSKERELLKTGNNVVVADTPFGRVGMTTCYDLRFPELYRMMVDKGAVLFLVAAAWPYPRLEHWHLFTRTRAVENLAFLVASNCCGVNQGVRFVGHSVVVDPWGVPVALAGDEEVVVKTEIDLSAVDRIRQTFPALADRRDLSGFSSGD